MFLCAFYSVCTGALLCGAAGLLHGKHATTHWTAMDVLPLYGAVPSGERVVIDGQLISAGGVTSGIDGSLIVVSLLRGETVAQELQQARNSLRPQGVLLMQSRFA
ncbi:DJ-1/PfpI family protein [Paraburkholderia sp. CNPSo 3281]|uniref:DJ-1/PfpI family protein n=1 Tax=Paraburkholderia sp. CNPSo 3281 TaxID=2940933 RepID=UPI00265D622B|nr:DJ-1/PfpI family protein [Paraburkholderia sp. CNPSo 3281]